MRGLTSRGVRPCVRQQARSNSFLTPVRRTVIPPTPKGITAADVFTILLPSVLTAAFVLDVSARQRRSDEWDRQIANVEAETEQLKQKQIAAWSRIQKRSVARGAREQRRMMSTFAVQIQQLGEEEMDPLGREQIVNSGAQVNPDGLDLGPVEGIPELQKLQKRYERLIAIRLALQLMLQLRTARTNLYTLWASDKPGDASYNYSMDYLVNELEKVSRLIFEVKIEDVPWGTTIPADDIPQRNELNNHLYNIVSEYRKGNKHLPDFVTEYADLIAEYKMGPSMQRYVEMMRAFSDVNRNSAMSAMCENAVWDGHQLLSDYAIAMMLHRYGTDADGARMSEFLKRLIRVESFPRAKSGWFRATVNDLQVAVPESRSNFLLSSLVRAALSNQQQTIAEAYATIFFRREAERQQSGQPKLWIVSSFLQSYAIWGSWSMGRRWLEIAIAWFYDIWEAQEDQLGRLLLRMLDFCVACNRKEEYSLILNAAIAVGMQVPRIDPSKPSNFSERMSQVRLDWINRLKTTGTLASSTQSAEVVLRLQSDLRGRLAHERQTGESPFDPLESKWMSDMMTRTFSKDAAPHNSQQMDVSKSQTSTDVAQDSALPGHSNVTQIPEIVHKPFVDRFPVPTADRQNTNQGWLDAHIPTRPSDEISSQQSTSTQSIDAQDQDEPETLVHSTFASPFFPAETIPFTAETEQDDATKDSHSSTLSFVAANYVAPSRSINTAIIDGRRGYASLVGPPEQISEYIYRFDSAMERVVNLEDKLRLTEAKLARAQRLAQDARVTAAVAYEMKTELESELAKRQATLHRSSMRLYELNKEREQLQEDMQRLAFEKEGQRRRHRADLALQHSLHQQQITALNDELASYKERESQSARGGEAPPQKRDISRGEVEELASPGKDTGYEVNSDLNEHNLGEEVSIIRKINTVFSIRDSKRLIPKGQNTHLGRKA